MQEAIDSYRKFGWCVFRGLIARPQQIAKSIVMETTRCILGETEEIKRVVDSGLDPLLLLTDTKLRKEFLSNPNNIWYNNNSRTPKLSKSAGMANIYHNVEVRDGILFDEKIHDAIKTLYSSVRGKEEDCVYLYGPDRVGLKPPGGTDMKKHIDCDILSLDRESDTKISSAPTHPLLMPRVQAVACLRCDTSVKNNGNTEVLSGYNQYFELGALFFGDKIKETKNFKGRKFSPIQLEDVFKKHLYSFIDFVHTFYESDRKITYNSAMFENYLDILPEEKFIQIHQRLPQSFVEIEWVKPRVEPGDLLCFDQRLPHRNTKNSSKKGIHRIVSYISMYPSSYNNPEEDIPALFRNVSTERKTYNNPEEREFFKDMWQERVNFLETPHTRRIMGVSS